MTFEPSGEKTWDLTGGRIRDIKADRPGSAGSCSPCPSPRGQDKDKGSRVMIALDESRHSEETIRCEYTCIDSIEFSIYLFAMNLYVSGKKLSHPSR